MIAVDTNILVYAHRKDSSFHQAAKERVALLAQGRSPWTIQWPCVHEFLCVVTHPRVYRPPTPLDAAMAQVDFWMESPSLILLSESNAYWSCLRSVLRASRVTGPRIHDARVASICQDHGVREFWSADRDFTRFPVLNVVNPLIE